MAEYIESFVLFITLSVVLGYLSRNAVTKHTSKDIRGNVVIKYSTAVKIILLISGVVLLAIVIAMPVLANGEPQTIGSIVFLSIIGIGLGFLGVYSLLEGPFVRIVIAPNGLDCVTPWRGWRFIEWSEISSIEFSQSSQWFIIKTASSKSVRAHLYLSGVNHLYNELKDQVSDEKWKNYYEPFE